jgi:hypothetical protein
MTIETFAKRTCWPLEELLDTSYLELVEVLRLMGLEFAFVPNKKPSMRIEKRHE